MSLSDNIGDGPDDLRWWDETDEKKQADAIMECVTRIERAGESDHFNDLFHASLYGNMQQFGFSPKSYARPVARGHARLSLNVVRNMISAAVSKIAAKNKVSPKFLTNDGDPSLERRCKAREKLVAGVFYQQKLYRKQRHIFRDIGIFGTGFIRPWMDKETRVVTLERVPKSDILVDAEEARLGDPGCLYHRKWYDKRVLAKLFPGKEDIISKAGRRTGDPELETRTDATADIIPVYESFHRRSTAKSEDGFRVVCVDSGVLGRDEWKHDYFPFPKLCWTEEPYGFFGTGLAYELAGIQCEINDVLLEFARAHKLIKGFWAVERGAKVVLKHINDDLGKIIQYAGVAPTYQQPVAIPPDVYKYLWDLYAKAYEIAGISQLSASGQKPAGLNSGEAQRVYLDEQTERFMDVGEALQDWTLDITEQVLDRAADLAQEPGGFQILAKSEHGGAEPIDFLKDADAPKDSYLIQVFPTSMLPNTPAGRLAFVNDMMEQKLISNPADGMKLLGFTDVEAFMSEENAPRDLLDRNLESILAEGKWVSPEPLDDHDLALARVPLKIAKARVKGVSKERLSLARRYVVLSARLQKLMRNPDALAGEVTGADPNAAPPPPPGPPPGGPPPLPPPGGPPPMAPPVPQAA